MTDEVSSACPDHGDDDDVLELGLGLSIGGGFKTMEETSRIVTTKDLSPFISPPPPSSSSSSSSSSSVNIPNSSISGSKRTAINSVSPPNSTSVVGWPPIRRAHRKPITANRIYPKHKGYTLSDINKSKTNGYLSIKVNMVGTMIGRKVDLNAQNSYEMLALTVEDMFFGSRSSTGTEGCPRLLNERSEFVLTYEDRDGDCMLVGDVPWPMFLNSVKRLRILKNPRSSVL